MRTFASDNYRETNSVLTKIKYINQNINPWGGINFVSDSIAKAGIPRLIDKKLGSRVKQAKYSYSHTILSWILANFCGAERLEDTSVLKHHLKEIPDTKFPSPDIIGNVFKKLSTPNIKMNSKKNAYYNVNMPLNKLLIDASLKLKLLNTKTKYVLDYDAVIIPAEKYDCEFTYKKYTGYSPVVSFVNKIPVYIEGRSGNASPSTNMKESLQRTLDLLREKNIKVGVFRSDAAAYQSPVMKMMDDNGIEFFIRAKNAESIVSKKSLRYPDKWENVEINNINCEIVSTYYKLGNSEKSYRVVITKRIEIGKDGKEILVQRAIITNNYSMTNKEIVHFYNQRGAEETNFKILLNDFNWGNMPFSFLNQNTTFWLIGAMAHILYRYIIINYSRKVDFIKENFRLKNFIFHFITVCASWHGDVLHLYGTNRDYGGVMDG